MDRAQIERISKALADATRLKIFEAISGSRHMNCGEIVSLRGVTPATVSHHLKILSEAGLIACRREGQFVYSEAVSETIEARRIERLRAKTDGPVRHRRAHRHAVQIRGCSNGAVEVHHVSRFGRGDIDAE